MNGFQQMHNNVQLSTIQYTHYCDYSSLIALTMTVFTWAIVCVFNATTTETDKQLAWMNSKVVNYRF